MARALGRDHENIDAGGRHDAFEMNVKAMAEGQVIAIFKSRPDFFLVGVALELIRQKHHYDIGRGRRFCGFGNFQTGSLSLGPGAAAALQTHHDFNPGVTQIVRVGVALAAVAQHGDFLALETAQIRVPIIINLHVSSPVK